MPLNKKSKEELSEILSKMSQEELDELLEFKIETLGLSAFNNFASNEASARSIMLASQLSAIVANYTGDERSLISSIDRELAKAGNNIMVAEDYEVLARHSKFGMGRISKDSVEIYLLVRSIATGEDSVIIVPSYVLHSPKHGYRLEWTETLEQALPRTMLYKGDILATTPTYRENFGWAPGNELIVAAVTHPFIIEDAGFISEEAAKRSKFSVFKDLSIEVKQDQVLLDLYGNDEIGFKPFPDLGEEVNEYGGLLGVRTLNSKQPVLLRKDNLRKPNFEKGEVYFVKEKSRVVDIEVRKGSGTTNEYLDTLIAKETADSNSTISSYNRLCKNSTLDLKLSNFIFRHMALVEPRIKHISKKNFSYFIKITVCVEKHIEIGDKMANLRGGKLIISGMLPSKDMPKDHRGRPIDLMVGSDTVIGRMNIGMLYEQYTLGAIYNAKEMIQAATTFKQAKDILLAITKIFKSGQYDYYKTLSDLEIKNIIDTCKRDDKLQVLYDISSKIRPFELIKAIENSPFASKKGKLQGTFMGEPFKNDILVGPMYYLTIAKSPSVISSSSVKLNTFGTAVAASRENKSKKPISVNPMKIAGESEVRIYGSFCSPLVVAELFSRNSDVNVMHTMTRRLLTAPKPTNISLLVDRDESPYGGGASGIMLNKVMAASGTAWEYTPDKNYK